MHLNNLNAPVLNVLKVLTEYVIKGKYKFCSVNNKKKTNRRSKITMKKLHFYKSIPSGFSHESNRFGCRLLLTGLTHRM